MKVVQFSVVTFPKLEQEVEFSRLRERFAPEVIQIEPYIPVASSLAPAELGEVTAVVEFISQARRKLSPLAIVGENWRESGELVIGSITQGKNELIELRKQIFGPQPIPLIIEESSTYEPNLILCRINNPKARKRAVIEALRIGKSLGVVDALVLIRTLPDGGYQWVAKFPFGVGRVDFEKWGKMGTPSLSKNLCDRC